MKEEVAVWRVALAQQRGCLSMKIKLLFAWYDLWVGAYWDRKNRTLYLLPIPCCGIVITWR